MDVYGNCRSVLLLDRFSRLFRRYAIPRAPCDALTRIACACCDAGWCFRSGVSPIRVFFLPSSSSSSSSFSSSFPIRATALVLGGVDVNKANDGGSRPVHIALERWSELQIKQHRADCAAASTSLEAVSHAPFGAICHPARARHAMARGG